MPTVSVANYEGEELLSPRIRSFMATNDTVSMTYDNNGVKTNNCAPFTPSACALTDIELNDSVRSHTRNEHSPVISLPDRMLNGSSNDLFMNNSTGFMSGSCSPPPIYPPSSMSAGLLPMRNHIGHPPYSALTSPCLSSKMNGQHILNCAANGATECHSLQNSPLYNHYSLNGGLPAHLARPLSGMSPNLGPNHTSNGLNGNRNSLFQDVSTFPLSGNLRALNNSSMATGCPQRELFPNPSANNSQNVFGSGLLIQDRLHYYALAQKHGFIVGAELERVKENSCRSTSQSYGRIAAHFRHRYGETEAKTKAAYLQIGVRVPSKDHVSEIVGKGGQKIKLIREETGALITTPGEHEEHVFIIEAPPEIAMRVAHHLTTRAHEITQSKLAAGERRRGSTSSQPPVMDNNINGFNSANPAAGNGSTVGVNCLLTPNGSLSQHPPPSTTLFSATHSPLHPSGASLATASVTNLVTSLRTPNGHLLSGHLSSLPSSPCNMSGLNGSSSVNQSGATNNNPFLSSPSTTAGSRVLLARSRISVPQELVGKIIGTQGSIITTIQKDTGTEIKSPPKEAARGPNATSEFEISAYQGLGLTSNQAAECRVQQAKQLIGHLVMRQLERRASEELDDSIVGTSSNLNSENESRSGGPPLSGRSATFINSSCTNGSNMTTTISGTANGNSSSANGWMWPDVAQMDSQEAREVLDRILAESKNKTRRAKELAATSPSNTGLSPNGSQNPVHPGSMINLSNSAALMVSNSELQPFAHMLTTTGVGNLFESSDLLDCPTGNGDMNGNHHDLIGHSLIDRHHTTAASIGLYSPQSHQFGNRVSRHALMDDLQANNARTVSAYNNSNHTPTDSTDLLSPYNRSLSTNLNVNNTAPIWNSLSTYAPASGMHPQHHQSGDTTEIPHTLSSLFTSSPPPHMKVPSSLSNSDDTLRKQQSQPTSISSFNLGGGGLGHHPLPPFNSNDPGFNSGGGDLSPTLQHHYRSSSSQMIPDPAQLLTRRHSDWVVSSSSLLADLAMSSHNATTVNGGGIILQKSGAVASVNSPFFNEQQSAADPSAFGSNSTEFDFIKAWDQLYLNSNGNQSSPSDSGFPPSNGSSNNSTGTSHPNSTSSNPPQPPHCPPGFELHQEHNPLLMAAEHLFNHNADDLEDEGLPLSTVMVDPWSNTDPSTSSNALFLPLTSASSKNSLFQSLFTNSEGTDSAAVGDTQRARLNAIWSRVNDEDDPVIAPDDILRSFASTTLHDSGGLDGKAGFEATQITTSNSSNDDSNTTDLDRCSPPASTTITNNAPNSRCGTIGEGRRRQRGGQNSVIVPNEVGHPLSSGIVPSVPEVA